MKHEINIDAAAAASAAAYAEIGVNIVLIVKTGVSAESAAPVAAASMLISCFIFISNF